jgi:type IV pilus assembly protein PilW
MAARHRSNAGFSLIELLIAITIGLVILTVLGSVFDSTSRGRTELDQITRLMENSRFAVDILSEDAKHAGFYGTFAPPSDAVYSDASPCDFNSIDVNLLGWNPNAVPQRFPSQLQGWDDPAAGTAALACLPDRIPGTDVVTIRRVGSAPVAVGAVDVRNAYVQASQCPNDAVDLRVSNTAAQFTLRTAACNPAMLAQIRRHIARTYYIARCSDCAAGDGIPSLRRLEFVDGAMRVTTLAEGVENMQIEYGFDIDDNGTPDVYRTTPTTDGTPTSFWWNVTAMRVHLLLRTTAPSPNFENAVATFDMGPGHAAEACPANFRCRLVTTTLRLANVAGRRDG